MSEAEINTKTLFHPGQVVVWVPDEGLSGQASVTTVESIGKSGHVTIRNPYLKKNDSGKKSFVYVPSSYLMSTYTENTRDENIAVSPLDINNPRFGALVEVAVDEKGNLIRGVWEDKKANGDVEVSFFVNGRKSSLVVLAAIAEKTLKEYKVVPDQAKNPDDEWGL